MATQKRTRSSRSEVVDQIKAKAAKPIPAPREDDLEPAVARADLVPSGCTVLNLALSDRPNGGYGLGRIVNVIGDSSSGKSILTRTGVAELARLPRFKDHEIIVDDAEHADAFDESRLFGPDFVDRVRPPRYAKDEKGKEDTDSPIYSETVEHFEAHLYEALKRGPFIYILDSLDAIDSLDEQELAAKNAEKLLNDEKRAGSFGTQKARAMSGMFRHIKAKLQQTDSMLIIVSQVRQNLDPMSFQKKKRSGGEALEFYSSHVLWLTHLGKITKTVNKRDEQIGNTTRIQVTKNKLTGKRRSIDLDIYYDYGVDDIGASVDWLTSHGFLEGGGKKSIDAEAALGIVAQRDKFIRAVEDQNKEQELRAFLHKSWKTYEDALKLERKPRF